MRMDAGSGDRNTPVMDPTGNTEYRKLSGRKLREEYEILYGLLNLISYLHLDNVLY